MTEYEDRRRGEYAEPERDRAEEHEEAREEPRDEGYEDSREEESEVAERRSFFQRLLFGDGEEADGNAAEVYGARELEDSEEPRELHGFTVERAASVIKDMPDDVPRKSAVRIVRQTLAAASIEVGELDRATRMREAKLESRIELSRGRVDELNEKTDEVISSLQEQTEKAREARDYGVSEEERKIGDSREGLSDVDIVREFFDIRVEESRSEPSSDQVSGGVEPRAAFPESYREDETQIMDPVDDDTQVIGDRGQPRDDADETRDERG